MLLRQRPAMPLSEAQEHEVERALTAALNAAHSACPADALQFVGEHMCRIPPAAPTGGESAGLDDDATVRRLERLLGEAINAAKDTQAADPARFVGAMLCTDGDAAAAQALLEPLAPPAQELHATIEHCVEVTAAVIDELRWLHERHDQLVDYQAQCREEVLEAARVAGREDVLESASLSLPGSPRLGGQPSEGQRVIE